jgi:hypothetical protein
MKIESQRRSEHDMKRKMLKRKTEIQMGRRG